MKYRKKPVVIEAMQFTDEMKDRVLTWITCSAYPDFNPGNEPVITITTLEGDMTVSLGDWVIKGVKGEFYPCWNDIFEATYDAVD